MVAFQLRLLGNVRGVDTMSNKTAPILVLMLVIGIGLLILSLLADVIGIGDDPGFGPQQTPGTIAGVIVAAVGLRLTLSQNQIAANVRLRAKP